MVNREYGSGQTYPRISPITPITIKSGGRGAAALGFGFLPTASAQSAQNSSARAGQCRRKPLEWQVAAAEDADYFLVSQLITQFYRDGQ